MKGITAPDVNPADATPRDRLDEKISMTQHPVRDANDNILIIHSSADETAKASEEVLKAKDAVNAAMSAAVAATAPPPPEEKKKSIMFKDAVGRKFGFPFHLCATWEVCYVWRSPNSIVM
jgi:hypothetical protein